MNNNHTHTINGQPPLIEVVQFKQNIGNVQALEKLGFEVKVQTCRIPEVAGEILKSKKPNQNKMVKKAVPFYQLRAEREKEVARALGYGDFQALKNIIKEVKKSGRIHQAELPLNQLMHQNYLSPFGGYTTVSVVTPAGTEFTGTSYCHIDDIFNRRIANAKAFGKVFDAMLEVTGPHYKPEVRKLAASGAASQA